MNWDEFFNFLQSIKNDEILSWRSLGVASKVRGNDVTGT